MVREECSLLLEPGKEYLVESRLHLLARTEGASSVNDLLRRIRNDPTSTLRRKVVEIMITSETTFFRDARPFEILRKTVLPDLLARRAADRTLTLWCAATSGGQEPYSVAMILRESFPILASWSVRFIGSDISRPLLKSASGGRYTQLEVNRGLPASLLVKYFRKRGQEWEICQDIRDMVEFHEINLSKPWPALPRMDIVFMRNVLIYLSPETRNGILAKVRRLLKPDGYLFLGGSESTISQEMGFEPIASDVNACFRTSEGAQIGQI